MKNTLPLAELIVHKPQGKRKLGLLAGKLTVPDDLTGEYPDTLVADLVKKAITVADTP